MLLHQSVQRAARQVRLLGGGRDITGARPQEIGQILAFKLPDTLGAPPEEAPGTRHTVTEEFAFQQVVR